MARVKISPKKKCELLEKNAYSCCVCKKTGIGLNIHHIDGDSSNSAEENLAVLCVQEHDAFHRPDENYAFNHLNLSGEKIRQYKINWESFVQECKKDEPQILAVINAFGTEENIVGVKLVFQWNGKIVFERMYQQLDGDADYWTTQIINEVLRFGKNIKIVLVNGPLKIDYCVNDGNSLSRIIDESAVKKVMAKDWSRKSFAAIYVNPVRASLAIVIFYDGQAIISLLLYRCGNRIRYANYKGRKSIAIKAIRVRRQVNRLVHSFLREWDVKYAVWGTGNPDNSKPLKPYHLPICWETPRIR